MTASPPRWESWAPPMSPPHERGLDRDQAEAIAAAWWETDCHLASALMWEAYAAILPPALAVAQVATGGQSVSYGTAVPPGELGLALSRAAWHRALAATAGSVELVLARRAATPARHDGNAEGG